MPSSCCIPGPRGPTGNTGSTGSTGTTGTSGLAPTFAGGYDPVTGSTRQLFVGDFVPFGVQEPNLGIVYDGINAFTFSLSGTYQVQFGANATGGTGIDNRELGILLNGVAVPGGTVSFASDTITAFGSTTVIFLASVGNTLQVQNVGTSTVRLGISSSANPNAPQAFISIKQIA